MKSYFVFEKRYHPQLIIMKSKTSQVIRDWAKSKLQSVDAGHDWWHIERVMINAKKLYTIEGGDWGVIELAVLLHDVPDPKFFDEEKMLQEIIAVLNEEQLPQDDIEHILQIIQNLSFSKQWSHNGFDSLEYRIVQDADRLDAIGAIGIARAFSYGGHKGREFYNPDKKPQQYNDAMAYRKSDSPTINHFYEKLLLLKDLMKTEAGKKMALQRHEYMEGFLQQFYSEMGQ